MNTHFSLWASDTPTMHCYGMRGARGVNFSVPSLKVTTDTHRYAGQIRFINVSASVTPDFTYSVCNSDVIGRILLVCRTISVVL